MRFRLIYLAPLTAFLALFAWAIASPIGASPDDDHHLVSAWCASGDSQNCLPGTGSTTRIVPEGLLQSSCFAHDPEKSAACQKDFVTSDAEPTELSDRGNFQGAYPPVYYAAMGLFAGPDIESAALTMRLVNSALCVVVVSLTYWLMAPRRRSALVWGWLITSVPLGLFLIASNNPSGWSVIGVGTAWAALLGYYEMRGRRRIGLGVLFAASVLMAAGSRADSAFFVIIAIGAVMVLAFARTRTFLLTSILPAAGVLVAAAFLLTSSQIGAGVNGFGDPVAPAGAASAVAADPATGGALLGFNVLNLPHLWAGVFGSWGLGWLDTAMPPIVIWAGAGAFIAACFTGMSRIGWRKGFVVAGAGALLILMPLYVLQKGGDPVGANVQPRYFLPLIVLFGCFLMLDSRGRQVSFSRGQTILLVGALSGSNLVALHTNLRRYVTGTDEQGFNLNAGTEWWWHTSLSPMMVWALGAAAFATTVVILVREVQRFAPVTDDAAPVTDDAAPNAADSSTADIT